MFGDVDSNQRYGEVAEQSAGFGVCGAEALDFLQGCSIGLDAGNEMAEGAAEVLWRGQAF